MAKNKLKTRVFDLAERMGLFNFLQHFVQIGDQRLYVLNYHRIDELDRHPWLDPSLISTTPKNFNDQMQLVARKYQPVSVDDVLDAIDGKRSLPRDAVLVTVDDGYRDFGQIIFPLAIQYGIKPVVFIPTSFVGEGKFWWDKLYAALRAYDEPEISTPFGQFSLGDDAQRKSAINEIRQGVKKLPFKDGMRFVDDLYQSFASAEAKAGKDTLTWDELRELVRHGATVAAHTHTHPLLSRIPFEDACLEIKLSQEIIQREIGYAPPLFAFPDGQPGFFNNELANFLRSEGFKLAFTTVEGSDSLSKANLLCFPRVGVWNELTLPAFHFHLTPVYSLAKSRRSSY